MQMALVNKVAMARYRDFISAMDGVMLALEDCERHINRVDRNKVRVGWTASTPAELKAFRRKALDQLTALRKTAKNHEADLISRDWRV